jgi:isoquinoline 1-oxidoreductase beta subunit
MNMIDKNLRANSLGNKRGVTRRQILAGSTGLTFAFAFAPVLDGIEALAQGATGKLNAYVTIGRDGAITIMTPAPEMGQGVNTVLPLIIAEELDADWSKVKVEQAPVHAAYNHPVFRAQYQVASLTTRGYWMPLRTAGAQARRVLLDAAAAKWNVPVEELTTEPSTVVHAASNRRMSYGEIASFAVVSDKLPEIKPDQLKPVAQFRLLGKDVPRIDIADKSRGAMIYASDVQVPGMLYGTIVRAPARGSGPVSFNRDDIRKQPGVVDAVAFDHGIGIVAQTVEQLFEARHKVKATWKDVKGSKIDSDRDLKEYLAAVRDPSRKGVIARKTGEAEPALAAAAKIISGEFTSPYVYHAQMEPLSCTASVTADGVEVWGGTQWPTKSVEEAAKAAGVGVDKVKFHTMQMGGGFGRRTFVEYVIDAVLLSKSVGKPVKMIQSREDDIRVGRFRPMTAQKLDVGVDADGKVVAWRHRLAAEPVAPYVYGQARLDADKGVDTIVIFGADMPFYNVPAHVTEHIYEDRGARVAAYRGIGAGYTNFAIEAMIDEVALGTGKDPLEFRLALLKDPRAKNVVTRVAEMADWKRKREGRALGVAFCKLGLPPVGFSMIATAAEISLDGASGKIKVHNMWSVADVGLPLQPGHVAAQVEGAIIFGLGGALKESISIKNGEVEQSNFHDYEVMRQSDVPQIKVEVVRSGDTPLPVGELGIGGTAPAVANAFLALTGKRLRDLPFSPDRVKAMLRA